MESSASTRRESRHKKGRRTEPAAFVRRVLTLRRLCRRRCRRRSRRVLREPGDVDAGELRGFLHAVVELRVDLLHAVPLEERAEDLLPVVGLAVIDERLLYLLADVIGEVLAKRDAVVRDRTGGVDNLRLRLDVRVGCDETVASVGERRGGADPTLVDGKRCLRGTA